MDSRKTKRSTWLFLGAFLLTDIANTLTFTGIPAFETLMTEWNYLI